MGRQLLFLGDSLIEYFDWAARFPDYDVYNLGISGETVDGLQRRLRNIFSRVKAADHIFIMSGINNLVMGDEDFIDAYRNSVREISATYPSATIHIQSLLPVLFPYISNNDIRRMNSRLLAMASDQGVSFLDVHRVFLDEKGRPVSAYLLEDGVHVSEEGYRVWSEEIEKLVWQHRCT
jgi:lysophospholipase L1-like esterase